MIADIKYVAFNICQAATLASCIRTHTRVREGVQWVLQGVPVASQDF